MRNVIIGILVCLSQSLLAVSLNSSTGKTEFLAVGRPAALKINGKGRGPEGQFNIVKAGEDLLVSGEARVDLSSFETGIEMRDSHMKDKYLEVEKFKEAKLTLTNSKLPAVVLRSGGSLTIPGSLDLHGKVVPVDVVMTIKNQAQDLIATSTFKIDLLAHGIEIPKYLGVTVAKDVTVNAETIIPKASLGAL